MEERKSNPWPFVVILVIFGSLILSIQWWNGLYNKPESSTASLAHIFVEVVEYINDIKWSTLNVRIELKPIARDFLIYH